MIGERVGNFEIVKRLGQGGMGEVWLGEQTSIRTRVAIKTLLPHVSANKDVVQRFFNEAIAVGRIAHSGIAKIFDVGFLPNGQAYLVMEFLDGETLTARIARSGQLAVGALCEIARQISSVLDATHGAGIIHRDLKPDNIFLVRDTELESGERVKVLDFGIAKLGGAGVTSTGMGAMGTPGYMSPEQWSDPKNVDWRADVYSLGCVVFEMAAGRVPFVAETIGEACTKHLTAPPPPLRGVVQVPAQLEALVLRMLGKEARARASSMKELSQAFSAIGKGQPAALAPTIGAIEPIAVAGPTTTLSAAAGAATTAPARRSPMPWIAGAIGACAIAAVAIAVVTHGSAGKDTDDAEQLVAARAPTAPPPPPAPADAAVPAVTPPVVVAVADAAVAVDAVVAKPPEATPAKALVAHAQAPAPPPPPVQPAAPPASTPASTSPSGGCDEVSCVLNNYDGACCAKFKKTKSSSSPPPPENSASETLDREMISNGVGAIMGTARACGERFPDAKGKVKVHVKVAPDGYVSDVSISETPDQGLGSCVATAFSHAHFAQTQQGGSFAYPVTF